MSFCGFFPALHVPLGSRVDVASRGGGALCTIVSASRDACPTVVDRRLQVLVVGPGGRNGSGWCGGAGSASASASAASSSTAAPAGALRLKGSDKLGVHGDELFRETFDRDRELGDGGAIACRVCRQVCDGVHRLLMQVPAVRVCGSVVCGAVGSAGLVSKREAPLSMCGREKHLEVWERLVVCRPLIPFSTIRRENACVEHKLVRVVHNLLA